MVTPAQSKATTTYQKKRLRQFVLRLNKERDADMIEFLESSGNYNKLLRGLVQQAMDKERG